MNLGKTFALVLYIAFLYFCYCPPNLNFYGFCLPYFLFYFWCSDHPVISGYPAPGSPPAWSWASDTGPGHLGGSCSKHEAEGRHSQRTCRAGVLRTVGDGEMRLWRLLEAEMRLPGQRGPSRSLLRRPRRGGGLGRCENEGLQPRAEQTGC